MSLLIKALDKAENDKSENDKVEHSNTKRQTEKSKTKGLAGEDLELSLSPTNSTLAQPSVAIKPSSASKPSASAAVQKSSATAPSLVSYTSPASSTSPKSAANVFSAKSVRVNNQNTSLALITGAGLVALLAMGVYFYQFVDSTPNVVIPPQPLGPQPIAEALALQQTMEAQLAETLIAQQAVAAIPVPDEPMQLAENQELPEVPVKKRAKKPILAKDEALVAPEGVVVENSAEPAEPIIAAKPNRKMAKSKNLQLGESIASSSASISVSKTTAQAGVNPVLMSAYEAYNAGDDASAQKLYKQVLQRDVRNVDALLGLGAIASRQGRVADANGWFIKVLEADPRNSVAQAAMLDNQPQGNEVNNESRIKNMLAKQPDNANLHGVLGNLYAEQNQWPAAQQAYFDAYSLNGSADNAFNLAVSLDQMGKPKLALPYYQRALAQATGASSIDKASLKARIAAIQ